MACHINYVPYGLAYSFFVLSHFAWFLLHSRVSFLNKYPSLGFVSIAIEICYRQACSITIHLFRFVIFPDSTEYLSFILSFFFFSILWCIIYIYIYLFVFILFLHLFTFIRIHSLSISISISIYICSYSFSYYIYSHSFVFILFLYIYSCLSFLWLMCRHT